MTANVTDVSEGYRPGYSVAAERIIEYIDREVLQPGDRLPTEAEFASMLGVSKSIAREALKTLAAVGRITVQRGRGIFVAHSDNFSPSIVSHFRPTNVEHIMMLFEFRAIQEQYAAELAAERATPAELMTIEKALKAYAAAVPERNYAELSRCDTAFHAAISASSHNPFLQDAADAASRLQREVVAVAFGGFSGGSIEQASAEHTAIFEAIRRGDPAGARDAALAHVERTSRTYQEQVARLVFPGVESS